MDFWDFNTRSGAWILALAVPALLIALRNVLGQTTERLGGGIGEPWLVLDARSHTERVVSAAWRIGIVSSGWIAAFGLILSVESDYLIHGGSWKLITIGPYYLIFVLLLFLNTQTA